MNKEICKKEKESSPNSHTPLIVMLLHVKCAQLLTLIKVFFKISVYMHQKTV